LDRTLDPASYVKLERGGVRVVRAKDHAGLDITAKPGRVQLQTEDCGLPGRDHAGDLNRQGRDRGSHVLDDEIRCAEILQRNCVLDLRPCLDGSEVIESPLKVSPRDLLLCEGGAGEKEEESQGEDGASETGPFWRSSRTRQRGCTLSKDTKGEGQPTPSPLPCHYCNTNQTWACGRPVVSQFQKKVQGSRRRPARSGCRTPCRSAAGSSGTGAGWWRS